MDKMNRRSAAYREWLSHLKEDDTVMVIAPRGISGTATVETVQVGIITARRVATGYLEAFARHTGVRCGMSVERGFYLMPYDNGSPTENLEAEEVNDE